MRDTFGCAGFLYPRSANLRTAATRTCLAARGGSPFRCKEPHHATPPTSTLTTLTPFGRDNDGHPSLFAVQPGVPIRAALEHISNLLDIAESLAEQSAHLGAPDNQQLGHACGYLVEMAKATVEACLERLHEGGRA